MKSSYRSFRLDRGPRPKYRSFRLQFDFGPRVSRWLGTGAPAASVCYALAAWVLAAVLAWFKLKFEDVDLGLNDFAGLPIVLGGTALVATFAVATFLALVTGVVGLFNPRRRVAAIGIAMAVLAAFLPYGFYWIIVQFR